MRFPGVSSKNFESKDHSHHHHQQHMRKQSMQSQDFVPHSTHKRRSLSENLKMGGAMEGWKEKMAWPRLLMFMVVVFLLLTTVSSAIRKNQAFDLAESGHSSHAQPDGSKQDNTWCPVPERFTSIQDGLINSTDFSTDKALLKQQVDRLSAVVNVPTISYDDNGDVDEDPRWHAFLNLHKVLKVHFPRVYVDKYE
jgi:hypothetical protein